MTSEDILKGNRLIAKFLQADRHPDHIDSDVYSYDLYSTGVLEVLEDGPNEQHYFHPEDMKFHESWDWLMPVVEKISDMCETVSPDFICHRFYWGITSFNIQVEKRRRFYNFDAYFVEYYSRFEAIYSIVVEFIKWYSDERKSDN